MYAPAVACRSLPGTAIPVAGVPPGQKAWRARLAVPFPAVAASSAGAFPLLAVPDHTPQTPLFPAHLGSSLALLHPLNPAFLNDGAIAKAWEAQSRQSQLLVQHLEAVQDARRHMLHSWA